MRVTADEELKGPFPTRARMHNSNAVRPLRFLLLRGRGSSGQSRAQPKYAATYSSFLREEGGGEED